MARPGTLVLVVGPSGAGKDALINAARTALLGDDRFAFPRRVVTRRAVTALEDHESISAAEFALQERHGAYALSWEAHGLGYGLPVSLIDDLSAGRVVVLNASRAIIGIAMAKFEGTRIMLIEASRDVRAARLERRGRESAADIAERLDRDGGVSVPAETIRIDNSGELADGTARFVAALRAFTPD